LGKKEYVRPVLSPLQKPIGGHCLVPNLALLKESQFAEFIKKRQ